MGLFFVAYLILHPALQIWSLAVCRGGWRVAAWVGLVVLGPPYIWSAYKVLGPKASGDLSGLLIMLFIPFALLYLGIVAAGGAAQRRALRS